MNSTTQKERAVQFRGFHHGPPLLVLPNVWDAASARIIEQAGFRAVATTSSGIATTLGYSDGQYMSRELMIDAIARITRVVACPVTADIEAGYGNTIEEVLHTIKAVIMTGAVGINIEDSPKQQGKTLVDIAYQVELIKAVRELATSMDVPLVINARTDVFLLSIGEPESRFAHAVQRANTYLQAGADCIYPIGFLDRNLIADLVKAINGPINIMGGPPGPPLPELAQLGVARVSLAGSLMRSVLGYLQAIAQELHESGSYTKMEAETLPGSELRRLFQ